MTRTNQDLIDSQRQQLSTLRNQLNAALEERDAALAVVAAVRAARDAYDDPDGTPASLIDGLDQALGTEKLKGEPLGEHEIAVNRHSLRCVAAMLHQLATAEIAAHLVAGAVPEEADGDEERFEFPEGVESCSPGVVVHDVELPHPCDGACGAVYVERADKPGDDGEIEATYKLEVGTWRVEL
jgi:hypothetical protein